MKLNEFDRINLCYPRLNPKYKNEQLEVTFLPSKDNSYKTLGKMMMYFNHQIADENDSYFIEFKQKCDQIISFIEKDNLSEFIDFITENKFITNRLAIIDCHPVGLCLNIY